MRILITGGSGFIGSFLSEKLVTDGHEVLCLDNLFTGNKENVAHLLDKNNFSFINHDIIDPFYFDGKIDQIYNLACPASPIHYQQNPVRTIKANTIGVINMLGLARAHGAKILQASTSEVYGDPEVSPQKENYRGSVNTIGPRACYDEGKRCAETLFFDYKRMHGMNIKVIRIFNTYGPKMALDDGRVMSNFIIQALKNENITIYGDGSQTRSFCYISDLVDGMVKMMNSDFSGPINLGNPNEMTIKSLAEMIIKKLNSKSKLIFMNLPEDDPKQRCPDISLAKSKLNWEPKVSLEEGLDYISDFFKKKLENIE
ncbi:NAD-dependent dehydratase [Candidatus Falkowbacteria bacterium HGW-Falkowbacteria-1]|jgi:UDP-glucuronate decarboxylase|uniref:UDP-glucuronate decarboxylase n=1 Tax=Candidatus Falkowbacteria bacterium HGW-Falkowbacteria-1 TaxID=2013768 RepID=A0A2N2EAW7_9BACT|nr:MAG: NAD-dependent dehydratase [Candidatus Falkowbacteria bacterium HGW-Falkowbacteria-1]